jgi:hypothetical protein
MLVLVEKVDKEYLKHQDEFILQRKKGDWEPLYDDLKTFDEYDSIYYAKHHNTMELLEKYARQNPDEFVKFNTT